MADEAREALAQWMLKNSYATGHGDTHADLLGEMDAQHAERESIFLRLLDAAVRGEDYKARHEAIKLLARYSGKPWRGNTCDQHDKAYCRHCGAETGQPCGMTI